MREKIPSTNLLIILFKTTATNGPRIAKHVTMRNRLVALACVFTGILTKLVYFVWLVFSL